MILYDVLQPIFVLLAIAFVISQCFVPEILGRPWFPLFRRSWKVQTKIAEAKETIDTKQLTQELLTLEKEAKCPIHR